MPIKTAGIPAMKPRVERYKQQYVTAVSKIKEFPKKTLIGYEKVARKAWRDLEGKPGDPYPSDLDLFHVAIYQATNHILHMRYPGTVTPWYSRFYNIQYGVKAERQRVYIQSNPTGARIWIDDVDTYRSTPNLVYVARDSEDTSRKTFLPGWHRLKLRKSGFTDFITDIYIGAGHGRDNPYKFGLAKPGKRIVAPVKRPTEPAATRAPVQQTEPPARESIFSPDLPVYQFKAPSLPSFPPIVRAASTPRVVPGAAFPPIIRAAPGPPVVPGVTFPPAMPPAFPARTTSQPWQPFPPPPRFLAGAKVSNSTLTFDGIKEPFDPAPPLEPGGLGQIRYRRKVFTPARFVPVTQQVLQSRQKLRPGARLAARARYPAKDPWVTDELVRWYADQVNAGTYRHESFDPQQTAILASWARRRGYIHSEMATRHLWLEQRSKSPLISYRAPYSAPVTDRPPPASDPSRLVRPRTTIRPPEPAAQKIKKEGGRYYKQVGPSWMLVKDVRGRTPAPRPAATAKSAYAARKQTAQTISSERRAWKSKMTKLRPGYLAQRGESFRKRQEEIRAALIRR